MKITKLYHFTNPYFPSYIEEEITMLVKDEVFTEIIRTKKELKHIIEVNKKKELINSLIEKSKENINLNLYKNTIYNIDLEVNTFFINNILDIVENYPSKVNKEVFTIIISPPELKHISSGKNPLVSPIELKGEEEMFKKLIIIKEGVIENITNYILFDYWLTKMDNIQELEDKEIIDLSDTRANEKIIILEKLGILKYLKQKEILTLSTNRLASVISAITGIKARTVQSYINPMNNPAAKQKNNPLKITKAVDKAIKKLQEIGFEQFD